MGTAPKRGAEEEVALGLARGLEEGRGGRVLALELAVLAVDHDLDDGEENPADVRLGGGGVCVGGGGVCEGGGGVGEGENEKRGWGEGERARSERGEKMVWGEERRRGGWGWGERGAERRK